MVSETPVTCLPVIKDPLQHELQRLLFVNVINDKKIGRLDFGMSQIEDNFKKSILA